MFGRKHVAALALAGVLVPATALAVPTGPGELTNPIVDPVACELCHLYPNSIGADDDPPYAPYRTWAGSMMANSARDPVFWAGVAVADQDVSGGTEICIRCHSPRAFLEGNQLATRMDQLTDQQRQGVECMLCHRTMEDVGVPPGNAMYTLDDVVMGTNVPRRGPWDFTDGVPQPPHSWINDPYLGSSRFCGTCHDVTTPAERVDDAGVGLGISFNEQRTYSEWERSAYSDPGGGDFASCQDCHMPAVEDMNGCTSHVNMYSHETGGRRHDLVGANRFMVEMLRAEYGAMGENTIADAFFLSTIDRMDELLATSATLDVSGPDDVHLGDGLAGLDVRVTNNTGHKLPSGYAEGRVMWLEILAEYGDQVVWTSGAWDQVAGLERDPQLRTYEGLADEFESGVTFHLLRNNHWIEDTRIPPLGLQPNIETDPVGDRYALLGTGVWPNYDDHSYDFGPAAGIADATPGDDTDDELLVTVRLRYLINTPEYIEFLGDEGQEPGADIAMRFDLEGGAPPLTLSEEILTIPIVGFGATGESTSTGAASGSSSTGDPDPSTSGTTAGMTTAPMTTVAPPTTDPSTNDTGTSDSGGATGGDGCGCTSGSPLSLWLLVLVGFFRRRL